MDEGKSLRRRYLQRYEALKQNRAPYEDLWRDIYRHIMPRRTGFNDESLEMRGGRRHGAILNGKATKALRILTAGMQSGITSPSRPWFSLQVPDARLRNSGRVRRWLDEVEEVMRLAIARSNFYSGTLRLYAELALAGTSAFHIAPDRLDPFRVYNLPVGSYAIASSNRLTINTLYRELRMTVAQLVEQFGLERVSPIVREQYEQNKLELVHKALHIVEPNINWSGAREGLGRDKQFRSVWMEFNAEEEQEPLLVDGFNDFPVLVPRWNVTGTDDWGESPAMDALGDIRSLMQLERDKAEAFAKVATPPMVGGTSLNQHRASLAAGSLTKVENPRDNYLPAYQVNAQALPAFAEEIRRFEQRIEGHFLADTWLTITNATGTMTATEVAQRNEEKMQQLGPVLEQLQDEFLDPAIDVIFYMLQQKRWIPEPPSEIRGEMLRVEYISPLAQVQKALGITSLERLASFSSMMIQAEPLSRHKINVNRMLDEYAEALGTKSDIIRTDDEADELANAEKEAAQAQAQGAAMAQTAESARTLSETNLQSDNALSRLLSSMAPGGMPA